MRADPYECFSTLASRVKNEIVVSGIGFHEWLALTKGREANCPLGQLGTTVPLALGIAACLPHRKVLCLTTDGDLLMELSVLPPLGKEKPKNMVVIVNDNECYQTTHSGPRGYWPTFSASSTDLASVAKACGMEKSVTVNSTEEFATELDIALVENQLRFIVIKTEPSLFRMFRPDIDNVEYKYRFARYIERTEGINILSKQQQDRPLLGPDKQ